MDPTEVNFAQSFKNTYKISIISAEAFFQRLYNIYADQFAVSKTSFNTPSLTSMPFFMAHDNYPDLRNDSAYSTVTDLAKLRG